jgi:uncharacterized protein Yka (UPF0111/DUF47 family)
MMEKKEHKEIDRMIEIMKNVEECARTVIKATENVNESVKIIVEAIKDIEEVAKILTDEMIKLKIINNEQ